jgi:hypothetical protein
MEKKNFLARWPVVEDVGWCKEGNGKAGRTICKLWWQPRGQAVELKTKKFKMCEFKLNI